MINAEFTSEINDLITENLYQWDTYQTLKITGINFGGVAPRVHFANKKSTEALVVNAVLKTDGSVEVSIPNTLLTEKYDILAYIYTNTGLTSKTIKSITIPIIARLKPSEYYQPSDEDIAQIEAIELEAKAIIDGLTASEYSSTETYKRPNIVYYQLNAYMCISNDEITGIEPTDTSKWQQICSGASIVSVSVNSSGNLVFTDSNGTDFEVQLGTDECELVDFPASKFTKDQVNNLTNGYYASNTDFPVTNESFTDVHSNNFNSYVTISNWNDFYGLFEVAIESISEGDIYVVLVSINRALMTDTGRLAMKVSDNMTLFVDTNTALIDLPVLNWIACTNGTIKYCRKLFTYKE